MSGDGEQTPVRIAEERAAKILERAAALDAERSSEFSLSQLREAAIGAGISPDAFEEAMRETDDHGSVAKRGKGPGTRAFATPEVARVAQLLSDIQQGEGHLAVVGERLEWSDGSGVSVSVTPASSGAATVVKATGGLRRRLLGLGVGAGVPTLFFFIAAVGSGESEFIAAFFASLLATLASGVGTAIAHAREERRIEKRAEWIRERLAQILSGPRGSD